MNPPRHDIRGHVDAIIDIASRLDPDGVDAALADLPPGWDVTSIVSERHGYGYIVILQVGVQGYAPAMGRGGSIAKAIRAASATVRRPPVPQDADGLCPHGSPDLDCSRCLNP